VWYAVRQGTIGGWFTNPHGWTKLAGHRTMKW